MPTVPQEAMGDTRQANEGWCTHCQVIPAQAGDIYCAGCANALRAYLATSEQAA